MGVTTPRGRKYLSIIIIIISLSSTGRVANKSIEFERARLGSDQTKTKLTQTMSS
jgi:hypothetical protein